MRDVAQAVDARFFVHDQRARTDQRRQLARRLATLQVHLEEAILRVHKPQRARHVLARLADDGGYAEGIAVDAHRVIQAGNGGFAFNQGQACPQLGPQIHPARHHDEEERGQGKDQETKQTPHGGDITPLSPSHFDRNRRIAAGPGTGVTFTHDAE